MAAYVFETMTQEQAAQFNGANDLLAFGQGVTSSAVTVRETGSNGLTLNGISLSVNGKTLTFPAPELSTASLANRVQFNDSSTLIVGTNGADTAAGFQGTASGDTIYSFSGNDNIGGMAGADFLNGGLGSDTINGGADNDRIYGNDITNNLPGGAADVADTLIGGSGGDYIQGNQGDDSIDGGRDSDRLFGGAGNDFIRGGSDELAVNPRDTNFGSDTINGNQGSDIIFGDAGDDSLRGGANDDQLFGGTNNDTLLGDNGNDTLVGGLGLDILTGGGNTNSFFFEAGTDSTFVTQGGAFANITDEITDFNLDTDSFGIGSITAPTTVGGVTEFEGAYDNVIKDNGATFTNLEFARTYAQGLLSEPGATGTSVAAVQVGTNTYIFWDGNGDGSVESAVRLDNINVTDVTTQSLFDGFAVSN